eukprot:COSAG04_NODE_12444_length_653_cov_0.637184_2_plen_74_part_01
MGGYSRISAAAWAEIASEVFPQLDLGAVWTPNGAEQMPKWRKKSKSQAAPQPEPGPEPQPQPEPEPEPQPQPQP